MSTEITVLTEDNLPAAASDLTPEELAALGKFIGQGPDEGPSNSLTRLSINYDAEYVDENDEKAEPIPLKRGHYKITVPVETDGSVKYVTAYAKTASFHPLYQTYRYSAYDSEENKSVLNTTQFKEWGDVVLDDKGGEFKSTQYKKKATLAYPEWTNKIKCSRTLYGTVSMQDAKDMNGEPVVVADVPCMWFSKGASFMPVGDALDAIQKRGSLMIYGIMELDTKREKNGGTTYFIVVPEWSKKAPAVGKATLDMVKAFADTVEAENAQIIAAFKKVHSEAANDDLAGEFSGADLGDDFGDTVEGI